MGCSDFAAAPSPVGEKIKKMFFFLKNYQIRYMMASVLIDNTIYYIGGFV